MASKPEINWVEGMDKPAVTATGDDDLARLIMAVQEEHATKCEQLRLIVNNPDKGLQIGGANGTEPFTIEAGTKLHKGVIIGVQVALEYLEKFPIELNDRSAPENDFDQDWEDGE